MSRVRIVGLDHFLQFLEPRCWTRDGKQSEAEQKRQFYQWLRELAAQEKIELIAEEADPERQFLGAVLARELALPYVNIAMPRNEWKKHGVTWSHLTTSLDSRAFAYRQFERYMCEQVEARAEQVIMVMCGRNHIAGLQQVLSSHGHQVLIYDVYNCQWFVGRPREDSLGVAGYDRP